ncbi:type II secretion system protein [Oribacterium sp. HCP3S3_B9]|uniref:type II secretion system protein n=1 Tax=Oribacterium sp. HCP3S3_B9 TaxID=3438946 RepID=UPI003F89297C
MKRAEKEKRGFTLAELLVVVAIIGVLVAISIPIFTTQLEKARRSVDLYNARAVESVLVNAINDGSVQLPSGVKGDTSGIWVTIRREDKGWPSAYGSQTGNVFYGASKNTVINGVIKTTAWNASDTELPKIVKAAGLDDLKINSRRSDSGKPDGWDWIVIEAGYRYDNTAKKFVLFTEIYSGFANEKSGAHEYKQAKNCIGKLIGA